MISIPEWNDDFFLCGNPECDKEVRAHFKNNSMFYANYVIPKRQWRRDKTEKAKLKKLRQTQYKY